MKSLFLFICIAQAIVAFQLNSPRVVSIKHSCTMNVGDKNEVKSIFIFGLGYVGMAVATALKEQGWRVSGTCRNINKINTLKERGIQGYLFDDYMGNSLVQEEAMNELLSASHVLTTVPPTQTSSGDPVLKAHGNELKKASLITNNNSNLKWVGYLSSTGVYGNRNGAWVTEQDAINPETPITQVRAQAESEWRNLYQRTGLPVHIFRLAGIYGPGRSAIDTLLKAKGDINQCGADDDTVVSRIHVDDIAQVICASVNKPSPGLILNVADDLPSSRYDVLSYCCRLLGYPLQPRDYTSSVKGTRGGSKRVDNTLMNKLLNEQNLSLRYPDYRSGLLAVRAAGSGPTNVYSSSNSNDNTNKVQTENEIEKDIIKPKYVEIEKYNELVTKVNSIEGKLDLLIKTISQKIA